jgi:hypothetical protein
MMPVLAAIVTLLVSGCSTDPSSDYVQDGSILVESNASIDLLSATIILPLDRYGMDDHEVRLVSAAQDLALMACVNEEGGMSGAGVSGAQEILAEPESFANWLYGYWDATFISANGWETSSGVQRSSDMNETDLVKAKECVKVQSYIDLSPIYPGVASYDSVADQFQSAWSEAYSATISDPEFLALVDERSACLQSEGYQVSNTGSFDGVTILKDATDEEILQAAIAEATCSDKLNFTEQAADINAGYQQKYIDTHQAELTALRQLADERVNRATQILRDAGVM